MDRQRIYKKIKYDYNNLNSVIKMIGGGDEDQRNKESRINKFYKASTELSYLSNQSIKNLVTELIYKKDDKFKRWGVTGSITIQGIIYFVKMIPISSKFMINQSDSSNLYNLPAYYNYGFGSAGTNPWRELMLHVKTTNYVLEAKCINFPLMYHHRIIEFDHTFDNFETGLGGKLASRYSDNHNIMNYLKDRSEAKSMIVLFLEHIPNVLGSIIQQDPAFTKIFYTQGNKIIHFLHENGITHNDAHGYNFLVDDNGLIYLTDFGVSLDKKFNLNDDEMKFITKNKKLDYYYLMDVIISVYVNQCIKNNLVPDHIDKKDSFSVNKYLMENIDEIYHEQTIDFLVEFIKLNAPEYLKFIKWKRQMKETMDMKDKFVDMLI